MNVQRFHAATSREALSKARMAFGDATLILSNRQTPTGVEVVATTEDMLDSLTNNSATAARDGQLTPSAAPPRTGLDRSPASILARSPLTTLTDTAVEKDVEKLAMSTLSFQDYVRERMLRRRHDALHGQDSASQPLKTAAPSAHNFNHTATHTSTRVSALGEERHANARPEQAPRPAPRDKGSNKSNNNDLNASGIVSELQSMRDLIEERFNTLSWLGQAKQDPIQSNLMLKLIRSGYSPALSRSLMERMPTDLTASSAIRWVMDVLERNLKTDAGNKPLHALGGIYALVGATGVGKTTTAAKLAALCAKTHGSHSVGLITLDTYRVAAHEQLRAYGRMLGVVAHLAHDRAALQDLLSLLGNKKMVLIDTAGLAPKDPRAPEMLELLNLPKVNNLLVLNAGAHGDTHDHVLEAFKTHGGGGVILTKTDEAAKLGPALDALIRHQTVLRGVTQGQRVPEDWEQADAANLVRLSMRAEGKSAYNPIAADLGYFFAQPTTSVALAGHAHA